MRQADLNATAPPPTRLAFVLPALHGGGAQRALLNLANHYAAQGIAVDMVLVKAEGAYLPLLDVRVRRVDLACPRVLRALPKLIRYLRQCRPSAVLVTMPHISIVAVLAKLLARVPCNFVICQPNYLSRNNDTGRAWLSALYARFACWMFDYADTVVTMSQGVADDLAGYGSIAKEKLQAVYNPIFEPRILELAAQGPQHPWLHSPRGYAVIVAVGRLVTQKNFAALLDAFKRVREQADVRLLILGEGPLHDALQAQIHALGLDDAVELHGFSDNPYAYLQRADLFVLSSSWEGFGNVIVEALAVGTPVVSTDCPSGPAEILDNGRYGVLVAPDDPVALADGILQALSQPWDKDELRRRAEDFAVDKIARQYQKILLGD